MQRLIPALVVLFLLTGPAVVFAEESSYPEELEWGRIRSGQETVELEIASIPGDRRIRLPRFNNSYRRIYQKGDPKKASLKLHPEVSEWLISLPKSVDAPVVVVIETVGKPQLTLQPPVATAAEDGAFRLPAHHAIVHGELLRFEPQPYKNTVGYWANEQDWCEWRLDVAAAGDYEVHVLQGCGKGHGGSEVRISVGDSELTFIVEDTGHFQKFKDRQVGVLTLQQGGRQSLKVEAVTKAKGAVMDVRLIRLVPVGSQPSS